MPDIAIKDLPPEQEGNASKGRKKTALVCGLEMAAEVLMVVNYLVFTKGVSYHKYIPVPLELGLLIFFAAVIIIFDCVTVTGNRISRVIGAAVIASTFFYNVMDFFLGLSMLGADDWTGNIPFFLCCTAVCVMKFFCVKNIFINKDIRAYFYKVNKARYGL